MSDHFAFSISIFWPEVHPSIQIIDKSQEFLPVGFRAEKLMGYFIEQAKSPLAFKGVGYEAHLHLITIKYTLGDYA